MTPRADRRLARELLAPGPNEPAALDPPPAPLRGTRPLRSPPAELAALADAPGRSPADELAALDLAACPDGAARRARDLPSPSHAPRRTRPPEACPDELAALDALLAAAPPRSERDLTELAALARKIPGRQRRAVAALAAEPGGAGLSPLVPLLLADVPGALDALADAIARGAAVPGVPPVLALGLGPTRARDAPTQLRRAEHLVAAHPAALALTTTRGLRVLTLAPGRLDPPARAALACACEPDLRQILARVAGRPGAALQLCGLDLGAARPAAQLRLVAAFLAWLKRPDG